MPATPRRSNRSPRPGTQFLSEAAGRNIKILRALRELSQSDLAERMTALGHNWVRQTVGEVESARRSVSIDELFGLVLALQTTVSGILAPRGPSGDSEPSDIDWGGPFALTADQAEKRIRPELPQGVPEVAIYDVGFAWQGNEPPPRMTTVVLLDSGNLELAVRQKETEIRELERRLEAARQALGSLEQEGRERGKP